jgi:hypothetical protein
MGNLQEELEAIELKRKELKLKLREEKDYRKANKERIRALRDERLENVDGILKAVLKEIFTYNKLGKVKKAEYPILDTICQLTAKQLEGVEVKEEVNDDE